MRIGVLVAAGFLAIAAVPAHAADTAACPDGHVCASKPETVVAALQKAGYQAKLDKDKGGDPMVSSASAGYTYDIYFYGCENHAACDSLQFEIVFSKDSANTFENANKWNSSWRYSQARVDDKGRFVVDYDVSTVGGLTTANFEDVVANWSVTLGKLANFWRENPAK